MYEFATAALPRRLQWRVPQSDSLLAYPRIVARLTARTAVKSLPWLVAVRVRNSTTAITAIVRIVVSGITLPSCFALTCIVAGLPRLTVIEALIGALAVWVRNTAIAITAIVGVVIRWVTGPTIALAWLFRRWCLAYAGCTTDLALFTSVESLTTERAIGINCAATAITAIVRVVIGRVTSP